MKENKQNKPIKSDKYKNEKNKNANLSKQHQEIVSSIRATVRAQSLYQRRTSAFAGHRATATPSNDLAWASLFATCANIFHCKPDKP